MDSHLSLGAASLTVVLAALACHAVFKRWEPTNLWALIALLVFVPASISVLFTPSYGYAPSLALSFSVYLTTLATSIVAYRLSPMHPLARYPGPTMFKVSKWCSVWIARGGKQHLYIHNLHEQYGDVIRIGPNEISLRDIAVAKATLGGQGLSKGPNWTGRTMNAPIPPLIAQRGPVEHARRRKPWNRALNVAALKEYQPHVARRVHQIVDQLARGTSSVDLAKLIGYFTYDLMGDIMFGGGTEIVRDGDKDHLWEILEDGLNTSAIFEKVPWLAAFAPFVPSLGKNLKVMRGGALMRTQQRYKSGPIHKDLFYYLSNEDGKEEVSPPPHIVISDGALALVAGSHTTSSVLANAIYLILCHPQVYGRLRRDIDAFYPPGDDAADPKYYAEIPYLDAVINETLRLFPAVPSGIQRAPVVGTGDKMIGPYYLPEGSNVRVHVWSLHHDPRNFSRPDAFWPERWLIADGFKEGESTPSSEKFNHNLDAFVPFSYGPAHCVGKNLAMQEMRVFVACMMHELNLRFTEGWDPVNWERDMEDRQSMRVGRLPVVAERRSGRGN